MNKKNHPVCAVIDIGSNNIKLRIAQRAKDMMHDLERLEKAVDIGHEVFTTGRISFELLRKISSILKGFSKVMNEYGVEQVRTVATTALRECKNRTYVADQLKIQNNINLEILEEIQEKTLIYSEILREVREQGLTDFSSTLISYIGTGSIGMAACDHGEVVLMQNIRIGSVKLHDVLGGVEEMTGRFHVAVEEYLDSLLYDMRKHMETTSISELILSGSEFDGIAKYCGICSENGIYGISGKEIEALYDQIKGLSTERICARYHMNEARSDEFYAVLAIYDRLLKITGAKRVYYVSIDVWDPLMRHMLIPRKGGDELARFTHSIASAERIARHYQCSPAHYQFVRSVAVEIFDHTQKYHGLSSQYRLFLELAAIMHECGHYISTRNHLASSYDVIKSSEIYGISSEEQRLIAIVAKYDEHSVPDAEDAVFLALSPKRQLIISKLVAIIRLANALDCSNRQKIEEVLLTLSGQKLTMTCVTDQDTDLEQWAFQTCAPFFKDVFGIKLVCEIKTKLL